MSAGGWTLERKLENSAVLETWEGKDAAGAPILLRRLVPELAKREAVAQAFLDEARVASTFDHAHLVAATDVGTDAQGPYAVYVRGPGHDLRRILQTASRRARLVPLPVAVQVVSALSRALQHIHERNDADGWPLGLLHGGVSPAVVHVGLDGVPRLDEFGLTRVAAAARAVDPATLAERLPYVTPEQLCAAPLDQRSDLFSAGVILYELTTGRRPFSGTTPQELMARIMECYPEPPTSFAPRYPADLERIVLRSLARIPEERYQTCAGLAKALADFAERESLEADADAVASFLRSLGIPAAAATARVSAVAKPRVAFAPPPTGPVKPPAPARPVEPPEAAVPAKEASTPVASAAPLPPPPPQKLAAAAPLPVIAGSGSAPAARTSDARTEAATRAREEGDALQVARTRITAIRAEAEAVAREAQAEAEAVRRREHARQTEELRTLAEELRAAVAARDAAREEAKRLATALEELRASLAKEEQARRNAETETARLRARVRDAEEAARTSSESARDREQSGRAAAERLDALREELEEAMGREAELRKQIEALVTGEAEARQELKRMALRLATVRREAESALEARDEARRDSASAEGRAADALAAAETAAKRESQARIEAEAARRGLELAREEAEEADRRRADAEAALEELRQQLAAARREADLARREADGFREQASAATSELDERELKAQKLARELAEREIAIAEKEAASRRDVAAAIQRELIAKKAAEAAQAREAVALADADAARSRAAAAEREAEAARRESVEARKSSQEAAREIDARRAALLVAGKEHERDREAWLAREAELVKAEASARMEAERLAREVETRAAQVRVREGEVAAIAQEASALRAERDAARTALQAGRVALEELREQLARAIRDAEEGRGAGDHAKKEVLLLRSERDAAEARAALAERERDDARAAVASLEERLAAEERKRMAAERDAESSRGLAAAAAEEALASREIAESATEESEALRARLEAALAQARASGGGETAAPGAAVSAAEVDEAPSGPEDTPLPPDTVKITFPEVALYLSSLAELPRSNIDPDASAFVGRENELKTLDAFLRGDRPILTLTGPPGSGRSRLALRFAASRLVELAAAGGAFCVDLSRARDVEGICTGIAHALSLGLVARQPLGEVQKHLGLGLGGRGRMLLILDEADAVSRDLVGLLTLWLPLAPQARFLVVAREPLGAPGERVLELGPLEMPALDGGEDARSVRDFPGLKLFASRLRERRKESLLAEVGADVIGGIVRRLGGWPLAIELAAFRDDSLTRLLRGLAQWAKDHPPVDAETEVEMSLAWAWSLLTPPERRMLSLCSSFVRPFTVQALRETLADEGAAVPDGVRSLRGKGLLRDVEVPGLEEPRLMLHPVVRHWISERHPPEESWRARHAARALRAGRELAAKASGVIAPESALLALGLEVPALEDALESALEEGGGADAALHAALGLAPWLEANPPFSRTLSRIDQALDGSGDADPRLRAEVQLFRGRARRLHGHLQGSLDDLLAAHRFATAGDDRRFQVDAAVELALTRHSLGESEAARVGLTDALALVRRVRDERREAAVLGALGEVARALGDVDAARNAYEEAISLHRAIGDLRLEGEMLGCLGSLLREHGQLAAARPLLERALAMHKEVRDRTFEARTVGELASAHLEQERIPAGRELYDRAIQLYSEIGDRVSEAVMRGQLGILEHLDGRVEEARAAFVRAIWILGDVGDRRLEGLYLGFLAALEASRGTLDVAVQSADLARRRLAGLGNPAALATVEILLGLLDAARARRASDPEASRAHSEAARKRLAAADACDPAPDTLRFARMLLRRALAAPDAPSARTAGG